MSAIPFRLGLQQRMLPNYRASFFDLLGAACQSGLSIFAGEPRAQEAVEQQDRLKNARVVKARNRHILTGSLYFCWQHGLLEWLETWQPQVLIMEANPRYLSSPRAVSWMRARRRGLVAWGLGAPPAGRLQDLAWRRFLSGFDAVIAYSQRGAQEYARLGFDPQRIFVAPNAVAPRPTQKPPTRDERFEHGRARVLYVGRLQERKRVDLLINACAALPPESQPELWIVGDGPARQTLERIAQAVYPQARFTGALYDEEVRPYFRGADLFVLPGTGGLAVQQAMSHGLPVIVAEADGTQSNLVRPGNGWVIPPGDQAALNAVLREALSDAQRLRLMGAQSYQIVASEVNLENMVRIFAQAVAAAYDQALKQRGNR